MPESRKPKSVTVIPSYKAYFELWAIGTILLYYAGLGLLVFLYIYLDRRARRATISADTITVKQGIFKSQEIEITIDSIRKVFVKQNVVQKYFDVGGLKILSTDVETPSIEIKYIADPYGLKALIARYHKQLRAGSHTAETSSETDAA